MVHNDIHDYTDTVLVRGVDHGLELSLCTEVRVGLGVVKHIVAVVGIVREVRGAGISAGGNVAVDLLVGSGDPDSVNAHVVEVALVDFLCDTREVAAVEGTGSCVPARERLTVSVQGSSVGVVVRGVSVIETVG